MSKEDLLLDCELTNPESGETTEFKFTVSHENYKRFKSAMAGKDKDAPIHNFVVACVDKEQRTELVTILRSENGLADMIAEPMLDHWMSKTEVVIKKRKPSPQASNQTALPN